jgi:hypothetical protein
MIADDLTGAADCAVAFAERHIASTVVWGDCDANRNLLERDFYSRIYYGLRIYLHDKHRYFALLESYTPV